MRCFGLTDLGYIIKLEVDDSSEEESQKRVILSAIVLDTEKSTFSIDYTISKHGDVVYETITENPREIHDRLSRARIELEKREMSFMKHLFLISSNEYSMLDLTKSSLKESKNEPD